jgi:hypothetical protein
MTYVALVQAFADTEELPIPVDAVLGWIRQNTDHNDIRLHAVGRNKKAFRGAFRRIGIPKGGMYGRDYDIITQILYGEDLPDDWKRLVICKEAMHVFDPHGAQVSTEEGVRKLIPAVILNELKGTPFLPAINDHLGAFKALAVLIPKTARLKFRAAEESRSTAEIARYVKLPEIYVDIWLRYGDELEQLSLPSPAAKTLQKPTKTLTLRPR